MGAHGLHAYAICLGASPAFGHGRQQCDEPPGFGDAADLDQHSSDLLFCNSLTTSSAVCASARGSGRLCCLRVMLAGLHFQPYSRCCPTEPIAAGLPRRSNASRCSCRTLREDTECTYLRPRLLAAHCRMRAVSASGEAVTTEQSATELPKRTQICTVVTAETMRDAVRECAEAATCGADIVELRLVSKPC